MYLELYAISTLTVQKMRLGEVWWRAAIAGRWPNRDEASLCDSAIGSHCMTISQPSGCQNSTMEATNTHFISGAFRARWRSHHHTLAASYGCFLTTLRQSLCAFSCLLWIKGGCTIDKRVRRLREDTGCENECVLAQTCAMTVGLFTSHCADDSKDVRPSSFPLLTLQLKQEKGGHDLWGSGVCWLVAFGVCFLLLFFPVNWSTPRSMKHSKVCFFLIALGSKTLQIAPKSYRALYTLLYCSWCEPGELFAGSPMEMGIYGGGGIAAVRLKAFFPHDGWTFELHLK